MQNIEMSDRQARALLIRHYQRPIRITGTGNDTEFHIGNDDVISQREAWQQAASLVNTARYAANERRRLKKLADEDRRKLAIGKSRS